MILFPPCKINLGLHILRKRSDGYHELDTLMYQVPFTDVLEIIPARDFKFTSSGLEIPGKIDSNLCVKAFHLMVEKFKIPAVQIHLHKIIPMGGGLGGGSANAAYTLIGIDKLFDLKLSLQTLRNLAAQLGSDCPLFMVDAPQIAGGRGELLSSAQLNLSGYYLKFVNLGIHVSTQEAFSKVEFSAHPLSVEKITAQNIETWKSDLHNDFENSVFKFHPALNVVKEKLYTEGAVYAAMSGSGSTMFGIFEHEPRLTFAEASFEKVILLK